MQAAARKNVAGEVTSHNCRTGAEKSRSTCRVELTTASQSQTAGGGGKHQEGREMQDLAEGHYCAVAAAARTVHCFPHSLACERPMGSCYMTSECHHL